MQLTEVDFLEYVNARCFRASRFDDGGFTAVVKKMSCGGFSVSIHDDHIEITLASSRKNVRRFGSIDSAAKFLKKCGFEVFNCMNR